MKGYAIPAAMQEPAPRSGRDPDGRGRDRVTGAPAPGRRDANHERGGGIVTKANVAHDSCETSQPPHHEDGYAKRHRL